MSKDENTVLKYLEKVNRPYSVSDIVQNLHNEVSKAAVQKALDHLVSSGKVKEKCYNKQKIYTITQNAERSTNVQQEVQDLEMQITEKTDKLKKLEQELKGVETELGSLQGSLSTSEAEKKASELQDSVSKLENKLALLSENKISISKADRDRIEKQYITVSKTYRKRKRICLDILNSILENYPKSKAVLMEDIGMEMDGDKDIAAILAD